MSFTSIPATYTDLCVMVSGRSARSGASRDELMIRLNSDTGNNYSYRTAAGDGSSAFSQSGSGVSAILRGDMPASTATANTFGNACIYIPNYAGSTFKSLSSDDAMENNATSSYLTLRAGLWSSTAAITTVTVLPEVSTFVQYSTATLYGIKNS